MSPRLDRRCGHACAHLCHLWRLEPAVAAVAAAMSWWRERRPQRLRLAVEVALAWAAVVVGPLAAAAAVGLVSVRP